MNCINSTEKITPEAVAAELSACRAVKEDNLKRYKDDPPGFYIETFGCQQNEADSERLAGLCILMGYVPVDSIKDAKLVLFNTCAIREHAEKKALSIIGEMKHQKAADPELIIGIGGCMVSQDHRVEKIKRSNPYVSFTFDTGAIHRVPSLVLGARNREKRRFILSDNFGIAEGIPTYRKTPFKAWLSIMYGCNNFCSYCIVPYVRGRERSRTPEDILREARELIEGGARDITLLGQNVNSYGKDIGEMDIAALMREICKIDGDFRLRFMTSHPKDASDSLIAAMAEEEKIIPHFHLPVQSGSTRVLGAMNRRYTREKYLSIIEKLKAAVPDVSITSDIIVAFPGETEEEFSETLSLLEEVRYDMIFSFIYSPREGTPAAAMDCQIDRAVANDRYQRLLSLQDTITAERNARFEGRTLKVLCDDVSKTDSSMMTGRADTPRPIHFKGDSSMIGKFINVKITKSDLFSLMGEVVE
ncbi:MAG: tRNA (N6-isopentenyl adenosine(37)-C2)-methylthiotransferase MiaB [Clostridia bacterium]|nr:tRNA (N6-isopentenyl adenosine(37)-C2)-methylthiotransferase MiaB [Clostridia bacterium]